MDLSNVPGCSHDLTQVFNKFKALSLPLHRPYDCAINLVPDSTLPSSQLYNLSKPEKDAMKKYIGVFILRDHPSLYFTSRGRVFLY